ncbi:putative RNA-directed DNA polymerase, eukaryota, reverse transcriptase zinc-binding domain protein [Tanacetum coccineum]
MARGSFNNSKSDGWTWVFGKNKKSQSKSIDNPFVKDVKKIATSFFVTNFPESMDAKSLWKEFQPFGRIMDAFIANKRSKIVCPSVPKGKVELGLKSHEVPVRPNNNGHSSKQSYASVANGVVGSKGVSSIGTLNKSRSILLNEHDLIKVDNTSIVVLVKVKEVDMISNMLWRDKNNAKSTNDFHHVEEEVIGMEAHSSSGSKPLGFENVLEEELAGVEKISSSGSRKDFDVVVKEACNSLLVTNVGSTMALHVKVKELKAQLKLRFSRTKVSEVSRKNSILVSLKSLDDKIHAGQATYEDKRLRVKTWHELDNLVNLESMGMFQKARVRWDVEGDENTKFFYGIINSKRNTQMIKGILHEGTWITDPLDIKSAFLNFYKDKFSCHDSFGETFSPDFRPISLLGFQYKIVAKILANRMSKVIDSIINHEQSAFISSRQILDGPLILSEVIDWYKRRKKKLLLFKDDFEKAIDFRISYLINGSPTSEFSLKIGLRQGDPLSPFLFIIVMEGLHITLRDSLMENMFRGVCIGSPAIRLSHLFYADDVIILSEWNQNDMDNIICILNAFHRDSGLKININKSNLYGVGVPSSGVARIASGFSASTLPLTYLGLPIGSNMGRILNWKVLIDRFKARLSGWKANMLS